MVSVENSDDERRVLFVISSQDNLLLCFWRETEPHLLSWFTQEILAKSKYPKAKIFTVHSSTAMLTTLSVTVSYSVASSIRKKLGRLMTETQTCLRLLLKAN